MANTVFGEVSYSDDFGGGKKNTNSKDLFLRLANGDNEIRIVTAPYQYVTHKHKKEGDPGFGQKVGCTMIHGSCQLCEIPDNAPKQRWFYGVIDRRSGAYKILDVSFAVFSKIRDLARNPKWGDPTKYDVNILVKQGAAPNDYYNVQPIPKEPLSATDQKLKDDADLEDLMRRCTPPTPEQQQRRLDRINGVEQPKSGKPASAPAKGAKVAPKAVATPSVDMVDDAELTEDFPDYDGAPAQDA
jgi:hypothetical protein